MPFSIFTFLSLKFAGFLTFLQHAGTPSPVKVLPDGQPCGLTTVLHLDRGGVPAAELSSGRGIQRASPIKIKLEKGNQTDGKREEKLPR